ncbi:hypothetical protein D3C75_1147440 [compost metagenome]
MREYSEFDNRFAEFLPGRQRRGDDPEMLIHEMSFLGQIFRIINIHLKGGTDIKMNIMRPAILDIRVQPASVHAILIKHFAVAYRYRCSTIMTKHIPGQSQLFHKRNRILRAAARA